MMGSSAGRVVLLRVGLHHGAEQEAGEPGDQDVEHDADDDLVDHVLDGEQRQHHRHEGAGHGRREQARVGVVGQAGDERGREGTAQELAFDGDVDDAGAFAQHAGQ